MDHEIIVFEIDRRARALGLRMGALCRMSKVSPSTPSRWKAGTPPNLGTIKRLTDKLSEIETVRAEFDQLAKPIKPNHDGGVG